MQVINGKILLSELAESLGITTSALRQHLHNPKTGLGNNAEKFSHKQTGNLLLDIGSVLIFLGWLSGKARKTKYEDIERTREELNGIYCTK